MERTCSDPAGAIPKWVGNSFRANRGCVWSSRGRLLGQASSLTLLRSRSPFRLQRLPPGAAGHPCRGRPGIVQLVSGCPVRAPAVRRAVRESRRIRDRPAVVVVASAEPAPNKIVNTVGVPVRRQRWDQRFAAIASCHRCIGCTTSTCAKRGRYCAAARPGRNSDFGHPGWRRSNARYASTAACIGPIFDKPSTGSSRPARHLYQHWHVAPGMAVADVHRQVAVHRHADREGERRKRENADNAECARTRERLACPFQRLARRVVRQPSATLPPASTQPSSPLP